MANTILTFFLLLFVHGTGNAQEQARLLGNYTNMVVEGTEDPHFISGYNLDLYQKGNIVFGSISIATGSGEPVSAELTEVIYKAKKKELSFKAEYSGGWEISQKSGESGREQRTVLTFHGTITPASVSGKIGLRDGYCGKCQPRLQPISLKRTTETFVAQEK